MKCPRCQYYGVERSKRRGFLEKRIMSLFGYYPWRCAGCSNRFFLRIRYKPLKSTAQSGS
jgi:hypothetical protein